MREKIVFIDPADTAMLKQALALVRDVFWEFDAIDYSDEGVSEFCDYIEYDAMAQKLANGDLVMLGCLEDGQLAGVLALAVPGHISLLFVAKAHHRQGIATRLLQETIRCVGQLAAVRQLSVNASLYAVPIYQKMGFAPVAEAQTVNGIRFVPMVLPLAGSKGKPLKDKPADEAPAGEDEAPPAGPPPQKADGQA